MKTKLIIPAISLALLAAGCDRSSQPASTSAATPTDASEPASTAPKTPWEGNGQLKAVYPDANAVKSIPLDYESFAFVDGDGMSAVPLPPYLKMATTIHAAPLAGGYRLHAGTDQCANSVVVKAGDQVIATLDPKDPANSATVPVNDPAGMELGIWLSEGAEVNFNCNVTITPIK